MTEQGYYDNVREFLGHLIGARVVDITQNDPGEDSFVVMLFDNGEYVRFYQSNKLAFSEERKPYTTAIFQPRHGQHPSADPPDEESEGRCPPPGS